MNFADCIYIKTNISNDNNTFLVDSQADICVIKISSIKEFIELDETDIIDLKGITQDMISSFGSFMLEIKFIKFTITHKFHVVHVEFPIPSDGIIGKDFIKLYACKLDYADMTFTVRTKLHGTESVKIHTGINDDEIILPPRSEIFRIFKIENVSFPTVILPMEIEPGVFSATTITHSSEAHIRILNTTDSVKQINTVKFKTDEISNYNIYIMNKDAGNQNRTKNLLNILENATPLPVREKLLNLCSEFADIFAMESDKMSVNNFYVQELKITDKEPVCSKNYRLPHSQKIEIENQINKLLENDLIEPSTSPYNSSVILVPKKSNSKEKNGDYASIIKK